MYGNMNVKTLKHRRIHFIKIITTNTTISVTQKKNIRVTQFLV